MTQTFTALVREAGLAAEGFASGATLLGKANAWQHGWYSHAFFALSIGLERSAKLAITLDHYITTNGQFPTDAQLRAYSHDIASLVAKAEEISQHRRLGGEHAALPSTAIHRGIIETISEFAKATRYYNLDMLAQGRSVQLGDPLAMWYTRVGQPILQAHYRPNRRAQDEREAAALQNLIGDHTSVRHQTETGDTVTSLGESRMHEAQGRIIRKWAPFYVMQIARFFAFLIADLTDPAQRVSPDEDIPYLQEFFATFMVPDGYIKSRRTWSAMRV